MTPWAKWTTIDKVLDNVDKRNKQRSLPRAAAAGAALAKLVQVPIGELKALREKVSLTDQIQQALGMLDKKHQKLLDDHKKLVSDMAKLQQDHETTKDELKESIDEVQKLEKEARESSDDETVQKAVEEIDTLKQEIADLKKTLKDTEEELNKIDHDNYGPPAGPPPDAELNASLILHTQLKTKEILFRTYKFCEDDADKVEAIKDLIPYLPVPLDIPEEEYIANYKHKVYEQIGKSRSYVQSEGKKRGLGKHYFAYRRTISPQISRLTQYSFISPC